MDNCSFKVWLEPVPASACIFPSENDETGLSLTQYCKVEPREPWSRSSAEGAYRSVCMPECSSQTHHCEEFKRGQFVYVATEDTLRRNASTNPDREDRWMARILEFRVIAERTFALVAWLYEPSELKGTTREIYIQHRECHRHGRILSDHVDIIDACSISDHADVRPWSSLGMKNDEGVLYWEFGYCPTKDELWSKNGRIGWSTPQELDHPRGVNHSIYLMRKTTTSDYDPRSGVILGQTNDMPAPEAEM